MSCRNTFFKVCLVLSSVIATGCMAEAGDDDKPLVETGIQAQASQVRGVIVLGSVRVPYAEVYIELKPEPGADPATAVPGVILTTDSAGMFSQDLQAGQQVAAVVAAFVDKDDNFYSARMDNPDTGECLLVNLEQAEVPDPKDFERMMRFEAEGSSNFVGYKDWGCACHKSGKYFGKICCGYYGLARPASAVFCMPIHVPGLCMWK